MFSKWGRNSEKCWNENTFCNECENEWGNLTNIKASRVRTEVNENWVTMPIYEEI